MTYNKKLIEVALPLEAINRESAREKSIRHGHPSTLHLWWARRPLAACRAVLFASLVDDPSSRPEEFPTEDDQEAERRRLFAIIEQLVKWDNVSNEEVLEAARAEIVRSCGGKPPPVLDPFCGGGSIPLEAQRLGLDAYASDLNPVSVLIAKALIEIPPKFANDPPVHPDPSGELTLRTWKGAQGLAEDVRYYGKWMRDEAERRVGHLYPPAALPPKYGGGEATIVAWIWARTVVCPNPACGARMPLVRSFSLSTRKGKEAWVEPVVDREAKSVEFDVRTGSGDVPPAAKVARGAAFRCLVCAQTAEEASIRAAFQQGTDDVQLLAMVADSPGGRVYLSPTREHAAIAASARPSWRPDDPMDTTTPNLVSGRGYGITQWSQLFTDRQLVALSTMSDLVAEARDRLVNDAGSSDYADAVATYLAFAVDKMVDRNSTICAWETLKGRLRGTFQRQAIPMTWDFAEANAFGDAGGDFFVCVKSVWEVLDRHYVSGKGWARQLDAAASTWAPAESAVCTDPPYYDNIGYADLADFFYVWLRRSIGTVYPDLFSTLLTPKSQELVAMPHRFAGNRKTADLHFEHGLSEAFEILRANHSHSVPFIVYYAFRQTENAEGSEGIISTGWEKMLEALFQSGFAVTGTWPIRSELASRAIASGTNALASSIAIVCRPRPEDAALGTRKEFLASLKRDLPLALRKLQHGSIAPVDLAQASIGPGIGIFSSYAKVVEADGSSMTVRSALGLINQALDEILAEQEGEFDGSTRWAIAWFEQYAMNVGPFGTAETLSKAKNTAVNGLVEDGIIESRAGKVRLLDRGELPEDWSPTTDTRLTVWEIAQHVIRALLDQDEEHAAAIVRQVGGLGEAAKDLAYRLYSICERNKWAKDALAYNALVVAWPEIIRLASAPVLSSHPTQQTFEG